MYFQSFPKPCSWAAICLGVLGGVALLGGVASAQPEDALYRDLWQTVQARRLFLEDPQLAPLNLGVKVTNRIAVLWGPVASQELSFRAEQRLRIMFELIEIRNGLTIEPDDNNAPQTPLAPVVPQFLPDLVPPAVPNMQRRPVLLPQNGVELAGIVTPETVTSRSSPLERSASQQAEAATFRLPFLGSMSLPR